MSTRIQLSDLQKATEAHDPDAVDLLYKLVTQADFPDDEPLPEGAYTFDSFRQELHSYEFKRKSLEEKAQIRQERIQQLESATATIPLPDRYRSHELIHALWQSDQAYDRELLLRIIDEVPLIYGPWKALKRIFKEAEANGDTEIYGALVARFDSGFSNRNHQVSHKTLGYLVRRAWRYFRKLGENFPAIYVDTVSDVLVKYSSRDQLSSSWVFNHIFFHETGDYGGTKFLFNSYLPGRGYIRRPGTFLKHRAFAELWKRNPRPLFSLLLNARNESVRSFGIKALKADFRTELRDVEPGWVANLLIVGDSEIDEFVTWILDNVPKFEQAKFKELGLHEPLLMLFDSTSDAARDYAAKYARTHVRDLPVDDLIELCSNSRESVQAFVIDILKSRDARKDIGLEAWGKILETEHGNKHAVEVLRKHFTAKELSPEWFAERIVSTEEGNYATEFARNRLCEIHNREELGWKYFVTVLDGIDPTQYYHRSTIEFVVEHLEKLDLNEIDAQSLRRMLLLPSTHEFIVGWIQQGKLKPEKLGAAFLKEIAFHPTWAENETVKSIKAESWGSEIQYKRDFAIRIFAWLSDVRLFSPSDLGFDWLMQLVQRREPDYHNFATTTMTKVFLPADFAESKEDTKPKTDKEAVAEIDVDLGGQTFVFTGKLSTMTRGEAQKKVTDANGNNSKSVGKSLDYLVIGDEGSPLYGQGRKGSKQQKAEQLNDEDAAGIQIISETAFLQMLAGETREFSEDAITAGCERIWNLLTGGESDDGPLNKFALHYLNRHHPEICLKETDRPVDPGAEIPDEFLNFERVKPLFFEPRKRLRDFAMKLASWDFRQWNPPIDGLIDLCESPYPEVREFVARAMTCDDLPEHRRYRVDPEILTPDAVYSFCESRNSKTRALGMKLLDMHPRLRIPTELFRLTESPDRQVRAFVIRSFWSLYRDRGIKADWKPNRHFAKTNIGRKKKKEVTETELIEKFGDGSPDRPEKLPAGFEELYWLLRRALFEISPGRPPLEKSLADPDARKQGDQMVKLKPMAARLAKLNLIETLRDLAIEDGDFANIVFPLLVEFLDSCGKSEQAACLVAVTRIRIAHPSLATEPQDANS